MEVHWLIATRGLTSIAGLHYECKTNMAILHKVTKISLTCNSIIVSKCQLKQKQKNPLFAAL